MHRGRHPVLMKFRTGVTKDGKLTGMHLQTLSTAAATAATAPRAPSIPARCRPSPTNCRATSSTPRASSPTSRRAAPSAATARRSRASARKIQLDKIAEKLGMDPAELRLKNGREANALTANWLKVGSIGLAECIRQVVERSGWKSRFGSCPLGKGLGLACGSYLCGAGLPIYLNKMPQSGVQLLARPQRPGHRVLRRHRDRPGLGRRAGGDHRRSARHRSARHPLRHRRYRHDAGRPRLVLEPRHGHDGQRRDPGGREDEATRSRWRPREQLEVAPDKLVLRERPGRSTPRTGA